MKASDLYSKDEFDSLIRQARANAETDWEIEFIDSIEAKYDEYGVKMFLSDKQDSVLRRLANGD
jgi:hypothetical protein